METVALPVGGEAAPAGSGLGAAAANPNGSPPTSRSAHRQWRSQRSALEALKAASSYLDADEEVSAYIERLSRTIGQQVGAERVAFWRLGSRANLAVQPDPAGFEPDSPIYRVNLQLGVDGEGVLERVIFHDEVELTKGTSPQLDALWRQQGLHDIKTSIAVSWRAGERRIGALAAYDSRRGFTANDLWLLRVASMATGLVWQYKEAEDELAQTSVRLEEAVAARRNLLNNIAAGGDEARRRFASQLHDDSLQLLTGAELQLERLRAESNGSHQTVQFDTLRNTLRKVEDSLRRLLINVSPEPLQLPHDLKEAISERLASMRLNSGIEPHIDLDLPEQMSEAVEAIVLKNVTEALTNVEKHAHATRVLVSAEDVDGGYRIEVADDGTGFVVAESVQMPGHLGLLAMRERAQLAGGWCRIESEPGAGARVEFWLPETL